MTAIVGGLTCSIVFAILAGVWKLLSWSRLRWIERQKEAAMAAEREQARLTEERRQQEAEYRQVEKEKIKLQRSMAPTDCECDKHPSGLTVPMWFTTLRTNAGKKRRTIRVCLACAKGHEPPKQEEARTQWVLRMEGEGKPIPDGWETSDDTARRTCCVCERYLPRSDVATESVTDQRCQISISGQSVCRECLEDKVFVVGARVGYYDKQGRE